MVREESEALTPPLSATLAHVLGVLGRAANTRSRPIAEVLKSITETAARTLGVPRVNIWLYDAERSRLTCIEGFDARFERHESGEVLLAAQYPRYFHALELLRDITALNVDDDPRTEELQQSYLQPHGVTAILDVPMLRSGQVIGVVCHEHVGAPREFSQADRLFAGSVGDLVSLVLEAAQREALELDQTRLRQSLARMAELESLGWLAAAIAHDFRNLLSVLFVNTEFLQATQPQSQASGDALRGILDAASMARDLCDQLQLYAGSRRSSCEPQRLSSVVSDVVRAFRVRLGPHIQLKLAISPEDPQCDLDARDIRRAVLNLLVNSVEAMPSAGGEICVLVRAQDPSSDELVEAYDFREPPGPCVLLEVTDTASGMTHDVLRRAFEPFFSTKEAGHGFGLATVLGTVRSHRGALRVNSVPGHGSSFRLWFPILP
jgi:two-component system, cell cycle sensor histidine kinase and response regulator CckA